MTLIFGHPEAQHPGVKIEDLIEIGRKDLEAQRHLHHRIVA
jgi:hypothetical protein